MPRQLTARERSFAQQYLAKLMRQGKGAQGAHGVGEKRVRAVEGMNESLAIGDVRPALCLHRAGTFQRELVKSALPGVFRNAAFVHQTQ